MLKIALVLCLTLFASTAHSETIKISGSGIMIPMVTDLANAYMKKNSKEQIVVNQSSLGQAGGIAALNAGAIDIAMSAMPITAAQSKLPIKPYGVAIVPGLIAVTKDVTVSTLTSQQLCDIYSGKIRNWKEVGGQDKRIYVMTRPESEPSKIAIRTAFACMKDLKEVPEAVIWPRSADMKTALETSKYAIGMFDAVGFHHAAGKIGYVKIDGKSHEHDKWPFYMSSKLVISIKQKPEVKKFLEFVKSPEGKAIIKSNNAKPVNFSL